MKDIDVLRQRAENATEKVAKQIVLIEKYEKQLEKTQKKAIDLGCDLDKVSGDYRGEQYWAMYDVSSKKSSLRDAKKKLDTLKESEEKLHNELKIIENQMAYLEGTCPEVLKVFLDQWKECCYQYYIKHYDEYLQFKEALDNEEMEVRKEVLLTYPALEEIRNREYVKKQIEEGDFSSYFLHNVANHGEPGKVMEAALKEKKLDWRTKEKRIREYAGSVVLSMKGYYDAEERAKWLANFLEREKKEKMLNLIERITSIVGTITDASCLHIGQKGDINGIITGEDGTASIETIGAGGYNIQCYHFRTLIHEVQPMAKCRGR